MILGLLQLELILRLRRLQMSKLKSRKFWVWLVSTLLIVGGVFYTKQITPEMVNMYGLISMIYIGGNNFSKYIEKK